MAVRAAYGGGKTEKGPPPPATSVYDMDGFPRRSITNRLKNVQLLQNKKKMRVFNERTSTTSMFPSIINQSSSKMNGQGSIPSTT
jgi:hypothetical protein